MRMTLKLLKWVLPIVLLLCPIIGFGQTTSFYTDRAVGVSPFGAGPGLVPIQYGQVRVCKFAASPTSPCTGLATITDVNGNALTVSGGNFGQLTTDVVGRFSFGCQGGQALTIQVAGASSNTPQLSYSTTCPIGVISPGSIAFDVLSATSLNNTQLCDAAAGTTADAKLATCQTALGPHGGVMNGEGFSTTSAQTLAAQTDIGSTTFPVHLRLSRAADFNVTISNGTSNVFRLFGGSSVDCGGETEPPGFAFQGGFNLANTANIASVFTLPNQSTVAGFSLKNCLVQSNNSGAVVGTAIFDLVNPLQQGRISGGGSAAIPNTTLLKVSQTTGISSGPFVIDNMLLDCAQSTTGLTGCTPALFTGPAGAGAMGGVLILGSLFNHPGSTKPALDLEGAAATNTIGGITRIASYTESTRNTDIAVEANNIHGFTDIGLFASARAIAGQSLYQLDGTTQGVVIINPDNFNLWTNNLKNNINSTIYPITNGRLLSYWYSGNSAQTKTNVWADSAGELAVIDTNGVTSKRFTSQAAVPATVGIVRVGNNEAAIAGRDTGNTTNAQIIPLDSSNRMAIVNGVVNGLTQVRMTGGSARFQITDLSSVVGADFSVAGILTTYGGVPNVANGLSQVLGKADAVAQTANIATTPLYTVPANGAGMYIACGYVVVTVAGTTSTMPTIVLTYTDNDSANVQTHTYTSTSTANTVGTNSTGITPLNSSCWTLNVAANTTIQYATTNYASTGTPMQYALHIKLQYLGN